MYPRPSQTPKRSETMSILSSVTSLLEPIKIPGIGPPGEDCKPTKCDDRGDEKHKGREESKNDDHEKQCKNDDHDREKHAKNDDHDREKHAKNDDHDREKHAKNDDHDREKHAKNDDHDREKHAKNDDHKDDCEKHAKDDDHSKHAKNDCQPNKDDCQAHKDYCEPKPSDDCGKGETHKVGEALAKFDFSHGDVASHAPDHSDTLGALASMSSGHALDYAIGQMGPADHLDVGHFDMPLDTSHDMAHHA